MPKRQFPATKIIPTIMIGDDIDFSTRNFKNRGKPPFRSKDCKKLFKKYVTDDTTDAILRKDYLDNKCQDITGIDYDTLKNPEYTILVKQNDSMNAKRLEVVSSHLSLNNLEDLHNKSGRHKATSYNIKDLTICSIKEEEGNIFHSKFIDQLRILKASENITAEGYLIIEE